MEAYITRTAQRLIWWARRWCIRGSWRTFSFWDLQNKINIHIAKESSGFIDKGRRPYSSECTCIGNWLVDVACLHVNIVWWHRWWWCWWWHSCWSTCPKSSTRRGYFSGCRANRDTSLEPFGGRLVRTQQHNDMRDIAVQQCFPLPQHHWRWQIRRCRWWTWATRSRYCS